MPMLRTVFHKRFAVMVYADYEETKDNGVHQSGGADPATSPTASSFTWASFIADQSWGYGGRVEVPLITGKLDATLGVRRDQATGNLQYGVPIGSYADLNSYDDYKRDTIELKARYTIRTNIQATLGYMYQMFQDGNQQNAGIVKGQNLYNSVASSYSGTAAKTTVLYSDMLYDTSYTAHVGYVMLNYSF